MSLSVTMTTGLPLPVSFDKVSLDYKVRQFLGARGMSAARAHYHWRTIFSETDKRELLVNEGDPVVPLTSYQAGTALTTLADMSQLVFKGTVDEIDVGKLKEGMPARIKSR